MKDKANKDKPKPDLLVMFKKELKTDVNMFLTEEQEAAKNNQEGSSIKSDSSESLSEHDLGQAANEEEIKKAMENLKKVQQTSTSLQKRP